MSYHNVQLQHDLINTLGNAVQPLPEEELIHKVINRGFKNQRKYFDDEVLELLNDFVTSGFVKNDGNTYEWVD